MTGDFGAGIYLSEDFDFLTDQTGDLRSEFGEDELAKDLALQMVISLSRYLGSPPTENVKTKVKRTAANVALADTRVSDVDRENIEVSFDNRNNELSVKMDIFTEEGKQELVFNI